MGTAVEDKGRVARAAPRDLVLTLEQHWLKLAEKTEEWGRRYGESGHASPVDLELFEKCGNF